jgi:uncharacterized coiled-coil protein SlyX
MWLCGSLLIAAHQTCLRHEQDTRGDLWMVWKQKFGGNEPSADTTEKAPAGVKGKKAAKPAVVLDGPKSPKVLELEAKVAEQGQVVRNLKAKTSELQERIKGAVDVLKRLKEDLEAAVLQCTKDNKGNNQILYICCKYSRYGNSCQTHVKLCEKC